jgi:hypothetical protein
MFKMKYLDGTPVEPDYEAAIASLVSSAAAAEQRVELDELEAHAKGFLRVAMQCTDRSSGRLGTFLHKGDFVAVSPVHGDYCELLSWMRVNGWESVPGTWASLVARCAQPVNRQAA